MNRRSGWSLIECIFAVVIVLIAFLAIAKINPMAYRGAAVSRDHLTALRVARNVIDQVRSKPFGADTSSLKVPYSAPRETVDGNAVSEVFNVTDITVTPFGSGGSGGTGGGATIPSSAQVAVTVSWQEGTGVGSAGVNKTLTLTSSVTHEP